MRQISVFNFITLDGYYKGPGNDISWHRHGEEENTFSAESMAAGNILLFGRTTYEMMAGFWPSPEAKAFDAATADGMNRAEKIVFSNTMKQASWSNTTVIGGDIVNTIREMKQTPGKSMTILGSGSILTLFAEHELIDSYDFMVDPVVLGKGTPIFQNLSHKLDLQLTGTRVFKSGTVLLNYIPMHKHKTSML